MWKLITVWQRIQCVGLLLVPQMNRSGYLLFIYSQQTDGDAFSCHHLLDFDTAGCTRKMKCLIAANCIIFWCWHLNKFFSSNNWNMYTVYKPVKVLFLWAMKLHFCLKHWVTCYFSIMNIGTVFNFELMSRWCCKYSLTQQMCNNLWLKINALLQGFSNSEAVGQIHKKALS